jgi:hypothetical protein
MFGFVHHRIRNGRMSRVRSESGSRNKNLDSDPQPCLTLDGAHTVLLNDHSAKEIKNVKISKKTKKKYPLNKGNSKVKRAKVQAKMYVRRHFKFMKKNKIKSKRQN